eukprot:175457_1
MSQFSQENQTENQTENRTRGKYLILAPSHKLLIAKEVIRVGYQGCISNHPRLALKRSSIIKLANKYKKARSELGREPSPAECGFVAKSKHLPLLGRFDSKIKTECDALRNSGGVINRTVLSAIITTKLQRYASYMLLENGGTIDPSSETLHQSCYRRWKYVKRRATSTRKNMSENERKEKLKTWSTKVNKKIVEEKIHHSMVVDFDETSVAAVPSSDYTMNIRGRGTVKIAGRSDKRNVTAINAGALNGNKLPLQVIYGGKTARCEVKAEIFPDDWDITHTLSHWSTNESKLQYLLNIIVVYMDRMRQEHGLPADAKGLVIFDFHKTNTSNPEFYRVLTDNHIDYIIVDKGMTDDEQPMDQLVNKKTKTSLRGNFNEFYLYEYRQWIENGNDVADFKLDLRWGIIKNRHAGWLIEAFESITAEDNIKSFHKCGITGIYNPPENTNDENKNDENKNDEYKNDELEEDIFSEHEEHNNYHNTNHNSNYNDEQSNDEQSYSDVIDLAQFGGEPDSSNAEDDEYEQTNLIGAGDDTQYDFGDENKDENASDNQSDIESEHPSDFEVINDETDLVGAGDDIQYDFGDENKDENASDNQSDIESEHPSDFEVINDETDLVGAGDDIQYDFGDEKATDNQSDNQSDNESEHPSDFEVMNDEIDSKMECVNSESDSDIEILD